MNAQDLGSLMELSALAGWNQTEEDWLRLIRLSPQGCRAIADGDSIVSTTTSLYYGTELGWIGMVLTRPEYRRQGLARLLIEDAIGLADSRGVRTLKLDATDQGRPLYESFGFVVEKAIERWGRDFAASAEPTHGREKSSTDALHISEELLLQDRAAFGADRGELLESLLSSSDCEFSDHGFVLSRLGKSASYLGPCVADSQQTAHELITARLTRASEQAECDWYWDFFPDDLDTVRLAEELGFTRRRQLWRMRRGEALPNNNAMIYAIAGFELG